MSEPSTAHRRTTAGLLRLAGALGVVALLAAGCGSSASSTPSSTTSTTLGGFAGKSPQAILSAACGATLPIASVAVATTFSKPSLVGGLRSMRWSMSIAADSGVLTYGPHELVDVVVVPFTTYVRAPAGWWATTSDKAAASSLADRWISISQTSTSAAIATPLIAWGNLSGTLANCQPLGQQLRRAGLTSVAGIQGVDVAVQAGFSTQTFSVPTESIPFIVRSVTVAADVGRETSLLSGFDRQAPIHAPGAATSIDAAIG
jgi:hypothetical protein